MTAVRPRGISETVASRLEYLVDPTGPWTLARGVVHSWLTPRDIGHGPESPGTAGRHCGHLNTGPELPGYVDPERPGTRALVTRDSWSTPRELGHGCESSRRLGRPHGTKETGASRSGQLIDIVGNWTRTQVALDSWWTPRPSDPSTIGPGELVELAGHGTRARVSRERWSIPGAFGNGPASPARAD